MKKVITITAMVLFFSIIGTIAGFALLFRFGDVLGSIGGIVGLLLGIYSGYKVGIYVDDRN